MNAGSQRSNSYKQLMDRKMRSILRIRAKLLETTREWFKKQGFTEVQGPIIVPATEERKPMGFEVKHFKGEACLAQGTEPYTEALMTKLGKVYTIAPTFRAETSLTKRHLTEYWRIEAQVPWCDLEGIIKAQEELITHICHTLCEEASEELKVLGRRKEDLFRVESPLPRLTYDQAIETLQKDGIKIFWGGEIDMKNEEMLASKFDRPFFVSYYPLSMETLFYKSHPQRPELSLSADLMAPEGYGEIASGGQMIDDAIELLRKMKEEDIKPNGYRWYIDLKKSISLPHSGFAMGVERVLWWICKLQNIRETIPFQREFNQLYP